LVWDCREERKEAEERHSNQQSIKYGGK